MGDGNGDAIYEFGVVRECSRRHALRAILVPRFRGIAPKTDNDQETIPNNSTFLRGSITGRAVLL